MRRKAWIVWVALIALILSPVAGPESAARLAVRQEAAPGGPPSRAGAYAGWAVEAYPEAGAAEMETMVRRQVENGANVVWIGHNNPGLVDAAKVEPGLSYAVYEAYLSVDDPRHGDAVAIVDAQWRMLEACRAVGVGVVLPVGYQIQMGQAWNEAHPGDLRRDAEGNPLDIYGGGVSASFYAPSYRRDIEAYYDWIEAEFVGPYGDVILMLNLADEPIGGDYSAHAGAAFRQLHGFGFGQVGDDAGRQRSLGEFQSRYVVEYAIYSAGLWQEIHPGLPVTMSFDGAQARQTWSMPAVEALFREPPDNFVVTFDAYPRDGLPDVPLGDQDLVGLFLLARSAGLYSARYERPLWLWAAANSWGLSQASDDPGTVSDAVANGLYLALLVRQGGGDLQGIAYWNYNVKEQGLYNDRHDTAYDTETMFERVSAVLPTLRELMAAPVSRPEVLLLSPPAWAQEQIGAERAAVLLEVQPYRRLAILAKENVNTAVVDSLAGWPLDGIRTIVAWSPSPGYLEAGDLAALDDFLAAGGQVVTSPAVGDVLRDPSEGEVDLVCDGLVERRETAGGTLYLAQQGIAVLFEDARHETLAGFWQEVLGLDAPQPGYRIVTGLHALYYHIGAEPVVGQLALPFVGYGHHYDEEARPLRLLYGSHLAPLLGRREFVFLRRDRGAWPWIV